MKRKRAMIVALSVAVPLISGGAKAYAQAKTAAAPAQDQLDRTSLPIAEPKPPTITEIDARKAKAPPRFEVQHRRHHGVGDGLSGQHRN